MLLFLHISKIAEHDYAQNQLTNHFKSFSHQLSQFMKVRPGNIGDWRIKTTLMWNNLLTNNFSAKSVYTERYQVYM